MSNTAKDGVEDTAVAVRRLKRLTVNAALFSVVVFFIFIFEIALVASGIISLSDSGIAGTWWALNIIFILATTIVLFYAYSRIRAGLRELRAGRTYGTRRIERELVCKICSNIIKDADEIEKCGKCNKTYHKSCADTLKVCPNCESLFVQNPGL